MIARCGVRVRAQWGIGPRPWITGGHSVWGGKLHVGSIGSPVACPRLKSHWNKPRDQAKRGASLQTTSDSDSSPSARDPKCKAP